MRIDQEAVRTFLELIPSMRQDSANAIDRSLLRGEHMMLPLGGRNIEIYLHAGEERHMAPVIFVLYGGGFALGDASQDDALCQYIMHRTEAVVIAVNYRKAPEHPYPAAVDDVFDTICYVCKHSKAFGIDPARIALIGFSAGGNLAVATCLRAQEKSAFQPRCQIVMYPFVDAVTPPNEKPDFPESLPVHVMKAFSQAYCRVDQYRIPEVSPLYAADDALCRMCPTMIVTAEKDALAREGKQYAAMLKRNDVPVRQIEFQGAAHGFVENVFMEPLQKTAGVNRKTNAQQTVVMAKEAVQRAIDMLNELL
jgi:acetyl esterase